MFTSVKFTLLTLYSAILALAGAFLGLMIWENGDHLLTNLAFISSAIASFAGIAGI
jgi:hypothetical protein